MWIINEIKKQALNTKTGIVLINQAEMDNLKVQFCNNMYMDLTIEEEILNIVPTEKICQIFDSLENFNYMDTIQVEQYINDELINYIEGLNDERI